MSELSRRFLNATETEGLVKYPQEAPIIFGHWAKEYTRTPELVAIAFARIIAAIPCARTYAIPCLAKQKLHLRQISTAAEGILVEILVAIWRLLRHDAAAFRSLADRTAIWPLRRHRSRAVRLLALHILSYTLDMADKSLDESISHLVGAEAVQVRLEEGLQLDLQIFSLEEDLRIRALLRTGSPLSASNDALANLETPDNVIEVAGVLLPSFRSSARKSSRIVPTMTSVKNLSALARSVADSNSILVQGQTGSGKTFLIRDLARSVGRHHDLVSIHLGDQTDAKLLLGTYITSDVPGQFTWQSGVLTNALEQGKWLLIEDIDKAPNDVLSIILPLLETGRVHIPSRNEYVNAAPGFKIMATKTTVASTKWSPESLIGGRLWTSIELQMPTIEELKEIITAKFPLLANLASRLVDVYTAVGSTMHSQTLRKLQRDSLSRTIGTIDLMKWCRRVQALYDANGIFSPNQPISQSIEMDIFSEAVDCFASFLSSPEARELVVTSVGHNLHVPPEQVRFYLESHSVTSQSTQDVLQIGRAALKLTSSRPPKSRRSFATTAHALRLLEQLMVAVRLREPLLLVGETGTGKTTTVQYLADTLGHNLVAINMSQQTESGDLLGGYKPVDTRLIAMPLLEEFERLFETTFPSNKNSKFIATIRKAFNKAKWSRLLSALQKGTADAIRLHSERPSEERTNDVDAQLTTKRRKLNSNLQSDWLQLSIKLDAFAAKQTDTAKGFSFAFVEGALVRAVQRGDWVLLDEINLTAPDTLESINGLLQEEPSILLSDKGDVEAITPHPDFRLFSCMNPATDIGKRDLPSGIRSRFTELYVHPPDTNRRDLLEIINKYIGGLCIDDVRAPQDVADLYLTTNQMVNSNKLVDGANQKPHYSVRTLSRTLTYVADISPIYGLRRSLYEGFCMSYLTLLNKESEALLRPKIEEYTVLRVKNIKAFLSQVPKQPQTGAWVQFKHYWLPKGPLAPVQDLQYILAPFVERNMLNLVRAASTKKYPILLQGPTSSGKTSMVEYLARMTGHAFVRINNHEHTDLQEYFGSYVSDLEGNLVFQEGILVQAVKSGHWLVLDELNLAPSDVLEALNRLLDDNRELLIPETQEVIKPHPNFILFATQNPAGLYGGRKHLSRAFRNRFLELHFEDIPEDELETILCQRCQVAPSYCKKIVDVYKQLSLRRQSSRIFEQKHSFATLRDLFRWATRPAINYDELALNGYILLAERVRREEEKRIVRDVIEKVMKVNLSSVDDYDIDGSDEHRMLIQSEAPVNIVWTRAMRRLFILVALAFRNNEPVLLVGETGCGKTAVCQLIAQALSVPIQMLNAHQNTETADIIGAQRPIRDRTAEASGLTHDLRLLFSDLGLPQSESLGLEDLRAQFETTETQAMISETAASHPGLTDRIALLKSRLARTKALFEWADGPLVEAMKEGQIFLLDEISLAEDAVLERLNSVLETSRTLVLAEKGTQESTLVGASTYQFCATMNPGGDFGKRELSPALRNRFTEIWVPAMSDDTDISQIVQATLYEDRQHLSTSMIHFARFFCGTFTSALTSSAVSIRDLLAWAHFCNQSQLAIPEAFTHGAALVYIDALGVNSVIAEKDELTLLQRQREQCLAELKRLSGFDCPNIYNRSFDLHIGAESVAIGPFNVAVGTSRHEQDAFEFSAPTTFVNATRVFRAMQIKKPILLEGSPGVGKTSLISAIAKLASRNLVRINLSDQTDLMDLFGSDTPVEDSDSIAFAWRDAPFLRAMQNGDWVLLDEMNLASQSILEGLNACLDHRAEAFIPELNKSFPCHQDFRIFAAQNPHSQGGDRKGLPKSFVNRFTVVYCDPLCSDDLQQICQKQFPALHNQIIENVVGFVSSTQRQTTINRALLTAGGPWEFNLRDVLRWLSVIARSGEEAHAAYYADALVRQRFRTDADRQHIDQLLIQYFGSEAAYRPAFADLSNESVLIGRTSIERDGLFQWHGCDYHPILASHRAPAEALLMCAKYAWPCIVVGSSGSGKTVLINDIAELSGNKVRTIAMNSDMDASDLLGSYEQRDVDRLAIEVFSAVHERGQEFLKNRINEDEPCNNLLHLLRQIDEGASNLDFAGHAMTVLTSHGTFFETSVAQLGELQEQLSKTSLGHFQWSDGSLVQAVRNGEWLILDNANLCKSSVLDRLNALLEPNGHLIVNERISSDGQPMQIEPHSNFRIFMTMDPRYGELSRAMRNRSLEVYLLNDDDTDTFLECPQAQANHLHATIAATSLIDSQIGSSRYLAEALYWHCVTYVVPQQLDGLADARNDVLQHLLHLRLSIQAQTFSDVVQVSLPGSLVALRIMSEAIKEKIQFTETHFLGQELDAAWSNSSATTNGASKRHAPDLALISSLKRQLSNELSNVTIETSAEVLKTLYTVYLTLCCACQIFAMHAPETLIFVLRGVQKLVASQVGLHEISRLIQTSHYLMPLTSGWYLQTIWQALRPDLPRDEITYKQYQTITRLLAKVDQTYRSKRSISQEMITLKMRYLDTLRRVPASVSDEALMPTSSGIAVSEGQILSDKQSYNVFSKLFGYIYYKLKLSQAIDFSDWSTVVNPALTDLVLLNSLAGCSTLELLEFTTPVANAGSNTNARLSLVSQVALERPSQDAIDGLEEFLETWRSLLRSTSALELGRVEGTLRELEEIGHQATQRSTTLLYEKQEILKELLTANLDSLIEIVCQGSETDGSRQATPKTKLSTRSLSSLANAVRNSNVVTEIQTLILNVVQLLMELQRSNDDQSRTTLLATAWIEYAKVFFTLYIPNVPQDPGSDTILHAKFCDWRYKRASLRFDLQAKVHKIFTGGQESPLSDLLASEVDLAASEAAQAPQISVYRPSESRLVHLYAEFDFCLATIVKDGPLQNLLKALHEGSPNVATQIRTFLDSLDRCVARLRSFEGYEDIVSPLMTGLVALKTGIDLLSSDLAKRADGFGHETSSILGDTLALLSSPEVFDDVKYNVSWTTSETLQYLHVLQLRARLHGPSDGVFTNLEELMQGMFQKWYIRREEEALAAAQETSVFKYSAPDEPSIDDYRELFPDYDGPDTESGHVHSHEQYDDRIFAIEADTLHIATTKHEPSSIAPSALLSTIQESIGLRSTNNQKSSRAGRGALLATIVLEAQLVSRNLQADRLEDGSDQYDFYHDANVSEHRKLIPMLLSLKDKISELVAAWPENSVLHEVYESTERLLALCMAAPLAKTLTMLEQLLSQLDEWQKVASREYSVAGLFDQIKTQIIDWRRFELRCWPRLFDLEETRAARADAKSWYNLYEVLIFAPKKLPDGPDDVFSYTTINLLMQFMRSASIAQYASRLKHLKTFTMHLQLAAVSRPRYQMFSQAIQHVYTYYHAYATAVKDHLSRERKILAKEVNQVIKLMSWKDTNIVALRDSARRSHRVLYKIVHKFRRILQAPALGILSKGLSASDSIEYHTNDSKALTFVASATIGSSMLAIAWPTRYQNIGPTIRKVASVTQVARKTPKNYLASFINDALDTMKDLRAQTPTTFDKTKVSLIKHLKNRKRKLLSDSFKALKSFGLRSVIRPDDLDRQKSIEDIFLQVIPISEETYGHVAQSYFYRIVDILPQIRAGYSNHSEDVTAGEVKRGIGYFDSILHSLISERTALVAFTKAKSQFDNAFVEITNMAVVSDRPRIDLDVSGESATGRAAIRESNRVLISLRQLLEVTQAYHVAHCASAHGGIQPLADQSFWIAAMNEVDTRLSSIQSFDGYVYLPQTINFHLEEHEDMLKKLHDTILDHQRQCPQAAYVFGALVDFLSLRVSSTCTLASSRTTDLDAISISKSLQVLADKMLSATQQILQILDKLAAPREDEGWYATTSIMYQSLLKACNLPKIAAACQSFVDSMRVSSFTDSSSNLQELISHFAPIIQEYLHLCEALARRFEDFHKDTSRCALMIGQTLNTLSTNGFCSPQPSEESGQSGATSEGTGLGTGEGVENITKDLEEDEDVGDLEAADDATGEDKDEEDNDAKEIEDDMAGDLEDVDNEGQSDGEQESGDGKEDIEDEIGEVEDENDTALDEKMWDNEEDDLREKKTEKQEAKEGTDQQDQEVDLVNQEGETEEKQAGDEKETPADGEQKEEEQADEADETDMNERPEPELNEQETTVAPEEANNLELPDDLNMDDASQDEGEQDADDVQSQNDHQEEDVGNDQDDLANEEAQRNTEDEEQAEQAEDEQEPLENGDELVESDVKEDQNLPNVEDETGVDDPAEQEDGSEQDLTEAGGPETGGKESSSKDAGEDELSTLEEQEQMDIDAPEPQNNSDQTNGIEKRGHDNNSSKDAQAQPQNQDSEELRSLGSALEQFRRMLHIDDAQPDLEVADTIPEDQEPNEVDQVQHVMEDQKHDLHAMGPSAQDDGQGAVQDDDREEAVPEDNQLEDVDMKDEEAPAEDAMIQGARAATTENDTEVDVENALQELSRKRNAREIKDETMSDDENLDKLEAVSSTEVMATTDAARLWQEHEQATRDLANALCEQLRLILEPTLATKLRGDFRTGKRLNMRRIIPYIASSFKKDKIWMRRARPSKRQYQVMLAIDDSKSMLDSSSIQLAFDTVALVSTALSVLEVGQMSVVKFGNVPEVVHGFKDQFSSDVGARIFSAFSFDQAKTDVKALEMQSLEMFREARASQHSSGAELWQLQFIISDGICEDHESLKRLMRQAQEERIMVVFIVIDTLHGAKKKKSILQIDQVKYLTQPDGSKKISIVPYMEDFAFENFLIIQNVNELPELLSSTLRQFFAASQ